MQWSKQRKQAKVLQNLHKQSAMVVVPNAWDIGSAYIFEKEGFATVGTSSAGLSYAMGYADGEHLPFATLVQVVKQMADRVNIPLSVDFERGYGETGEQVKASAKALVEAGAVGFNLEDGQADGCLSDIALQREKIEALVQLKKEMGVDFFINARTCAFWLQVGSPAENMQTAISRGNAFLHQGADCVFVPGVLDKPQVEQLVQGIHGPVNIILNGSLHDFDTLTKIGVNRLSIGSSMARHTYGQVVALSQALKKGDTEAIRSHEFTYQKANDYFASKK